MGRSGFVQDANETRMMRFRDLLPVMATIALGMFFLVAGAGKLFMGYDNFSPMMPLSFMPENVASFIFFIVPFTEIVMGLLLVFSIAVRFIASVSSLLVAGFIASNLYMINGGLGSEPCTTCFGVFGSLSVYSALLLDGIIAVLIIAVVLFHRSNFMEMTPWYLTPVHKPDGVPSLGTPPRAKEICKS